MENPTTREEIENTVIWPARMIFFAKRVTGKALRDCNDDERYEIKKYLIETNRHK